LHIFSSSCAGVAASAGELQVAKDLRYQDTEAKARCGLFCLLLKHLMFGLPWLNNTTGVDTP